MSLENARVLVTGATGFIGSRLVQRLAALDKMPVAALVHSFQHASLISRFPVEMIRGDVLDPASLAAAMKGCTHVVHAAVSFAGTVAQNRAVTVEGARNVCEAAHRAGVRRVVYLSTISVYGTTSPGVLDESSSCRPTDAYGRNKLDAEGVFCGAAGTELTAVILRMPVVYGPWSFWSSYPMRQFSQGCVVLPDDGSGICNALYVDDAVQGIVCALDAQTGADSVTCLVSGPGPVTWRQFYEEHGKARREAAAALRFVPRSAIRARSQWYRDPFARLWKMRGEARIVLRVPGARLLLRSVRSIRRDRFSQQSGRSATAGAPIAASGATPLDIWPDPTHLELMASQSLIEGRAAEKLIGFRPAVPFAEGVERTRSWLRWARLGD